MTGRDSRSIRLPNAVLGSGTESSVRERLRRLAPLGLV